MVLSFTIFFMSFSVVCAILPALMFCLGVMMWVKCFRAEVEFKDAAVEANPAIVISKHSRSSGDMSSHHITFEFEDGGRKEYRIGYANEAALIGVGDAGVAFTKQSVFLAFDRVT
jgi:hypothetical protein